MQNTANIQTKTTHPTRKLLSLGAAGEQHLTALAKVVEIHLSLRCAPWPPCTSTPADNSPSDDDVHITDTEHTWLPHVVHGFPMSCSSFLACALILPLGEIHTR